MNALDSLCLRIVQLLQMNEQLAIENKGLKERISQFEEDKKADDPKKGLRPVNKEGEP